jgi:PDZ domain-containing protein
MTKSVILHKVELLVATGVFVLVLILSLVPVGYRTTAPGYNHEAGDFISIDGGYESEGTFHTTSVISLNRTTILQRWVGDFLRAVDVVEQPEYYDDINISDLRVSGALAKNDSLVKSLVVGASRSQFEIEYSTNKVVYLTYFLLDSNTLEIGDIVLSVNGNTDITAAVSAAECEETAQFTVLRDDIELTFDVMKHRQEDNTCLFGVLIRELTEVSSTEIEYTFHPSLTTGSSGGLMQSLYIFNQLTPNDLTGGLRIAGTGTISPDGSVGPIGGVRQKIYTSVMNDIDVFFIPYLSDSPTDNYIIALEAIAELETDMILVPVSNIDDAIAYLESRFGGAFNE